jgi:L-alanine-DL-glutamate epimerase-like enolase superfamily enzyme
VSGEASAPTVRVARVSARVFRAPLEAPVRTSFGVMHARPALFMRVEDTAGATGYGEVWCNCPSCGAEHRARLVETVLAPLLEGCDLADPPAVFADLTARTAVLALQSGEPGPLQQCIAGLDIALWDLAARRAGLPLWQLLAGEGARPSSAAPSVAAYASGLNPDRPEALAVRCREAGHRAFKLKVGFGEARDVANLLDMRAALGHACPLMVDANQAWDLDAAMRMARAMARFELRWLEEPLRADRPWSEWRSLAAAAPMPLAAGENVAGEAAFEAALAARALGVVQPDVAKWGGLSGCLPVARSILAAGARYCPHYLGGGIGLLASAHLLAAVGGDGMLEIDANPNPLREATCGAVGRVEDGRVTLGTGPGLGVVPDLAALDEFAVRL